MRGAVHVGRGRRVGFDDGTLGIELRLRLRAAAEGPIRLLQSVGSREAGRLHLDEQLVTRDQPGGRFADLGLGLVEAPFGHGAADRIRRAPAVGVGDQVIERRAGLGAGREQRDIGLGQDALAEWLAEIHAADRLEVIQQAPAGQWHRRRAGVGRRVGVHFGLRVWPDRARHAREHRSERIRTDRVAELGDERPRRGMPVALRRGVRGGSPGVEREGVVGALGGLLARGRTAARRRARSQRAPPSRWRVPPGSSATR